MITVLPMRRPNSTTVAVTSGAVRGVTMTSSNGILCTGEKKCIPMTCSGRLLPAAILAIGIVLVFVAKMASCGSTASASAITLCLTARSSNTASITSGRLPKQVYSVVPATSDIWSSNCCLVICRLLSRSLSTSFTAATPLATCAAAVSLKRTGTPCCTVMLAMPAPMNPAPSTPTRSTARGLTPSGTPASFLSDVVA